MKQEIVLNNDIISHILSYGDVYVTMTFQKVLNDIIVYKKEFEKLRTKRYHIFYGIPETKFIYYLLVKIKNQKSL